MSHPMRYTDNMDTNNNTQGNFRTRLVAFLLVLAVGFAMGWFNGRNGSQQEDGTSGVVASGQLSATDDESSENSTTKKEYTSQQGSPSQSDSSSSYDDTASTSDDSGSSTVAPTRGPTIEEDGWYTSKDEVALYIHTYGHLPGNFISKTKARARGWVNTEGNLDEVCPGMSIGGSEFYNDDGRLPDARGRRWTECDINYTGGYRGAERIVFSSDGLIFYTADHYETFEQLY